MMAAKKGKGYSALLKVPRVSDEEWISQHGAARRLDVAVARIGLLIAHDRLTPVENAAGEAGVTVRSVEELIHWRETASIRQKVLRALKDNLQFF
jgi:hypothetical protein